MFSGDCLDIFPTVMKIKNDGNSSRHRFLNVSPAHIFFAFTVGWTKGQSNLQLLWTNFLRFNFKLICNAQHVKMCQHQLWTHECIERDYYGKKLQNIISSKMFFIFCFIEFLILVTLKLLQAIYPSSIIPEATSRGASW